MPGEGDHSPSLHLLEGSTPDEQEGNGIQALVAAELDLAELQAEHGRILPAHVLDVRTVQRIVLGILNGPGMAVAEVVLMSVHYLSGIDGCLEACEQARTAGLGFAAAGNCEHYGEGATKDRFQHITLFYRY